MIVGVATEADSAAAMVVKSYGSVREKVEDKDGGDVS